MFTLLFNLLNEETCTIYNDGRNVRHFTYIGDAVEALIYAYTCNRQLVNVVNPVSNTVREFCEEVAKYNVPHLHRQKVSAVKNGRKTKVMAYWYDESYEHEVTYTGKAYKEKMMRKKDIQDLLDRTRNLPKSKEERMEQMRRDPRYLEIGDKFYSVKFIVAHPEQFNPFWVERAMENIKDA